MITAQEARILAGPSLHEKDELLCETIKALAIEKKRSCRTGYDHKHHDELWISGGYSRTKDWYEAKKTLEQLGFKVSFYYSAGSIAVDMYTLIEW